LLLACQPLQRNIFCIRSKIIVDFGVNPVYICGMNLYQRQIQEYAKRRKAIVKRAAKGESQADIARDLGVTRSAVCKMLKKERAK
jgi:Homeodomain-like domain